MIYDFDSIVDRRGTRAVKWDMLPAGAPSDAIPVWVADMDLPCAAPILEALHRRIDNKILGYTLYGDEEYRQIVFNWYSRRFGWSIQKDSLCFSPGIVPALAFLINILSVEGDGIIIQPPVYYPFSQKIRENGRRAVCSPLVRTSSGYVMDYADLAQKFADSGVRGMILCSPHNPVGRVWTEEELRELVRIAEKYDKWIISDEIHGDLTRRSVVHTPLLKAAPDYGERIAVCTAPSKTFNLAGMQFSNILIQNKQWREKWERFIGNRFGLDCCPPLGLAAATAAYTEGEEWLEQVRAYIDANISFAAGYIAEYFPKAVVSDCQGTYLMWIDFSAYCADAEKLEAVMQRKARIAFDEGYIFGSEGAGFERLNVACPRSILKECMERLRNAFAGEGWI